ncbi:hypothetical protein [Agrococcus sp. TSP3-2-1]|uniref:hypothetical protein n=1 Tax=Agrococcus sp. TSP3-2-1 TaxID=2804583 RepID=UPI003CF51E25
MTIAGDLHTMASALGQPVTDERVLRAMTLVGLPVERSEFDVGPSKRTYLTAEQGLGEFLFEDGALDTVFLYTQPAEGRGAHPAADSLIEGLSGTATRAEVLERFGEPEWSNAEADRFEIDGAYFVRFGYADDRVEEVTVMREAP